MSVVLQVNMENIVVSTARQIVLRDDVLKTVVIVKIVLGTLKETNVISAQLDCMATIVINSAPVIARTTCVTETTVIVCLDVIRPSMVPTATLTVQGTAKE